MHWDVFFVFPSAPPPTLNADGVSWLSRQAGATVHLVFKHTPACSLRKPLPRQGQLDTPTSASDHS